MVTVVAMATGRWISRREKLKLTIEEVITVALGMLTSSSRGVWMRVTSRSRSCTRPTTPLISTRSPS